ncbi:hypothetical protein GCM10010124_13030 [Pilimelia terevasa]|uniref:Uncharacterized protein n=1 Tax=Pilimelia terevasa TaxID=53372 RepID=A0A8J3FFU8_9ACTN|nr:hypothetical protein [Pilimelia terevasa]GGK21924.1 hypothetical protein GCM10010124_13030 [Pilimelia terevasa]
MDERCVFTAVNFIWTGAVTGMTPARLFWILDGATGGAFHAADLRLADRHVSYCRSGPGGGLIRVPPGQAARWRTAADVLLDELRVCGDAWDRVRRRQRQPHWRLPFLRTRLTVRLRHADGAYRRRVTAATRAYQPSYTAVARAVAQERGRQSALHEERERADPADRWENFAWTPHPDGD